MVPITTFFWWTSNDQERQRLCCPGHGTSSTPTKPEDKQQEADSDSTSSGVIHIWTEIWEFTIFADSSGGKSKHAVERTVCVLFVCSGDTGSEGCVYTVFVIIGVRFHKSAWNVVRLHGESCTDCRKLSFWLCTKEVCFGVRRKFLQLSAEFVQGHCLFKIQRLWTCTEWAAQACTTTHTVWRPGMEASRVCSDPRLPRPSTRMPAVDWDILTGRRVKIIKHFLLLLQIYCRFLFSRNRTSKMYCGFKPKVQGIWHCKRQAFTLQNTWNSLSCRSRIKHGLDRESRPTRTQTHGPQGVPQLRRQLFVSICRWVHTKESSTLFGPHKLFQLFFPNTTASSFPRNTI